MHVLYQIASYVLFALLFPIILLHPKLRNGVRRRFGFYGAGPRPWPPSRVGGGPRIWLHGASAGDLLAISPVAEEIRERCPNATVIISTMTNSGHAMAKGRLRDMGDAVTFVPYDLAGATRRAMAAIQPDLLVLEYAELWPNLIEAAKASGARVALTNGRLNERLVARYRLLHAIFGNQLQKLDLLLMREPMEAERAQLLGAPKSRVRATGNTKFDHVARPAPPTHLQTLRACLDAADGPLWVAGSTHEGEERMLLDCFVALKKAGHPKLRLVIAPRYVERAGRIVALARRRGVSTALRSKLDAEHPSHAEVVVLDSIGELSSAYALASVVFVGGSFVPRGGQNILEPAAQGRPVLFGPYMANFRDSVEVLVGRGGIQVPTVEQLHRVVNDLLRRPAELERLGAMARAAVERVRGASARNAVLLLDLVDRAQCDGGSRADA
ncbi:MAG: 3-deoxy-D-manno-octulosonic acid transferase [Deltaproteobacteria bacterium]|nr:3-deoxy-D-manno-octulosonic acid transferase [Deltaproteobacteria bacterium]